MSSTTNALAILTRRGYVASQTMCNMRRPLGSTMTANACSTELLNGSITSTASTGVSGSTGNRRYKSVVAADSSTSTPNINSGTSSTGCPFTGNKEATSSRSAPPKLVKVPTLPFLGSTLTSYSGTPKMDPSKLYEFGNEMHRRFGDFYSYGFPGFGVGLHGKLHAITDPNEFLKVVRAEGSHPSGAVQQLWTFAEALKLNNSPLVDPKTGDVGLLGQGESWKSQRTFFQTGMLDPRAAKAYIPSIVEAARLASKGAPKASEMNQLNHYLNLCAFDMFSSVMFGELTKCAGDESSLTSTNSTADQDPRHAENIKFCKAAMKGMELSSKVVLSPKENFLYHVFGVKYYQSPLFKEFFHNWDTARNISLKKLKEFEARYRAGTLNKFEENSYMANAFKRFDDQQASAQSISTVSHGEVMDLSTIGLFAGVDTTSAVVAWNLMHVAMNTNVQEKLYEELKNAIDASDDKKLTAKILEKKSTPYLHSILLETYRLTPPVGMIATKTASQSSINIHGETLEKGSKVVLEPKYMNAPDLLKDCRQFRPERWSVEEVAARKGTALEEMDHALFRDNFGQGARRCPGSRVATNEVLIMLAQLVLDYEIRTPSHIKSLEDVTYSFSALLSPNLPQLEFIPRQ